MKRLLIGLACLGMVATASAQDPLTAGRDLYASASYEEALRALTELRDGSAPAPIVEQADQYRAFCLFALGRDAEAKRVAESLISKNPPLQLDTADASPRIAAMFADIRRTLLPALVRERYTRARTALDSKDFAHAEPELVEVRAMLDEADRMNLSDPILSDMRLLVDGFLELTRTSTAAVAKAAPEAASPIVAAPAATAAGQVPPADPPVYDSTASDVSAPVSVVQNIPVIPQSLVPLLQSGQTTVMLDLLIDERGNVERASMRNSRYPVYEGIVLRAARGWRYLPARKDGVPVKYLRTIAIVLQK